MIKRFKQFWNSNAMNIVKFVFIGLLIAWAFDTWRFYGVLGVVGLLLLIPVTMYLRNRHNYNMMYADSIARIETVIWGKTRDTPRWKIKKKEDRKNEEQHK